VAGALELDRVVVVEVVEAENGMALVEQAPREVEADEAGRAGDEEGGHRRKAERGKLRISRIARRGRAEGDGRGREPLFTVESFESACPRATALQAFMDTTAQATESGIE